MIKLKRAYEKWENEDGFRILVDRLWPRGISKEKAHIDIWMKEIAPSNELRRWFSHDVKKWEEFEKKYKEELEDKKELINQVKDFEKKNKIITLVFGAKDTSHNQAVVILNVLKNK